MADESYNPVQIAVCVGQNPSQPYLFCLMEVSVDQSHQYNQVCQWDWSNNVWMVLSETLVVAPSGIIAEPVEYSWHKR